MNLAGAGVLDNPGYILPVEQTAQYELGGSYGSCMNGKYAEDIKDYEKVHDHILHLADTLSSGIQAQFPDKVK
jgi:hypothetical protein